VFTAPGAICLPRLIEERVRVRRSEQDKLRTGDVVTERFLIERGDKQIGEFSRTAIADNLSAGIFFKDDWFWLGSRASVAAARRFRVVMRNLKALTIL
jgi:hypothetical protein